MSEQKKDRDIVIAVFKERSSLQQMLAKDELIAANLEIAADEAILVTKDTDGTLSISRSSHSVGRSLAVLSTKLLVVVPLGSPERSPLQPLALKFLAQPVNGMTPPS
jgi:hypothetical protein